MSKQCTLFRAWGGTSSSTHTTTKPCSSTGTTSGKGEAYTFDNFDQFDEFFEDDVTEELVHVCDYPTAEQNETEPSRVPFHSPLNASVIEDIPGFDVEAGQLSIYPTNYPIRDYQFNIVQKALFRNTLVCLPTGLGKTFIAAVVMYNFYRWYPSGKIIFLAPTKPLVTQQIEACYNVMGIPQSDAAEMTGNLPPRDRNQQWQSRRVFFLTPQVMQNDLARGACPAEDVCCVVFDEAHKALGNHAYCQVVRELAGAGSQFRVLALSATPGNDLKAVQQVVSNLQIGQIELRSEDSFDIQRYVHERRVEKFVVPFEGEILEVKTAFLKVLSGVVSRLARLGLLYHSNADRMSKYQILQARDQFRMNPSSGGAGMQVGVVEGDFALSISLYHAYELLLQHGMRSFYQFLSHTFSGGQSRAKMEVMRSPEFGRIMRTLQEKLGRGSVPDSPGTRPPRHGSGDAVSGRFFYSHPKLIKLEEVVLGHFRKFQEQSSSSALNPGGLVNTRVMIFSQYRESVQEIADMLAQHVPLVRVMNFVGHSGKSSSKGLTQKEQTEVVRRFREGGYNTLVATCVGEEGLDIGEVDLIVCFDAHKSPIRLVQRMGRTGRKRSGRIVVIVSEGKEEQIYLKSQSNKNSIHRAIRDGCRSLQFYHNGSRMVPRHIHPTVHKMHMSIDAYIDPKAGKKGRVARGRERQSRLSFGPTRKDPKGVYLTDNELDYWSRNFALSDRDSKAVEKAVDRCVSQSAPFLSIAELNKQPSEMETSRSPLHSRHSVSFTTNTSLNSSTSHSKYSLSLSKWIHWQTAPTSHKIVGDSLRTNQLMSSLEFMDLLHTSEGIGQSYELEMGTFLNPEDVNMDWRGRRGNLVGDLEGQQEAGGVCVGEKRRARKRQRIFDDSSEDEDFQPPPSKSSSAGTAATEAVNDVVVLVDEGGGSSCRVSSETWDGSAKEGDEVVVVREESCPPGGDQLGGSESPPAGKQCDDADMGSNLHHNDRDCFTTSQCVVPKAPSVDSLDWLDAIEPSQVSSSTPKATSVPKRAGERSESEFQFVTPKVPPSLKNTGALLLNTYATPSGTHATPIVGHTCTESIDLFNDISSAVLFEDFSISTDPPRFTEERPNEHHSPRVTPELRPQSEKRVHKSTSPSVKIGGTGSAPLTKIEENCLGLNEEITVIAESDLDRSSEDELELDGRGNQQIASSRDGPSSTETEDCHNAHTAIVCDTYLEDSFIVTHGRGQKKSRKGVEFLRSPISVPSVVGPSVSPSSKKNTAIPPNQTSTPHNISKARCSKRETAKRPLVWVDSDSSGEELPLLRRIKKSNSPVLAVKPTTRDPLTPGPKGQNIIPVHGYLEEEAELSSDGHFEGSSDEELDQDFNDYDCDDSFINDASLLTQVSPIRPPTGTTRGTRPPASMGDVYRRSLMSPDTLFAGKRRGGGNQYRMVFSQRHRLLDHYINKAGFKVAPSARKSRPRKRLVSSGLRCAGLDPVDSERHLLESTSSSSEAEEVIVCYGEEELEELPNSESAESVGHSPWIQTRVHSRKQKAGFLLDSDMEISEPQRDSDNPPAVRDVYDNKRMRVSASSVPPLDCTAQCSEEVGERASVVQSVPVRSTADVIISPSLLASIKVHRTPACFSLGMEEWMDSDDEGDEECVLQPDPPHLAMDDELGDILTQKELEENFDLKVDGFSDPETEEHGSHGSSLQCSSLGSHSCGAQEACGRTINSGNTGNSNQTATPPDTAVSLDTRLSTQTTPLSGRTASVLTCNSSPRVSGGTILVSSRTVMYSQIVSTLRYKHHLQVTLCSLSHGGYIVSNRMVAERKLHSEFVTASTGGKVLTKVRELKELFDRVCLIVEEDPVREGRRNSVPKPGHFLQYALARLIASNITVLFSQSQENTASLLVRLVERERKKGHGISISGSQQEDTQPVLQMLLKIPRVSYITALNLCSSFRSPHMLLQSSPEELKKRVPSLSLARAQGVCDFFRRKYNPHLVG